MTKHYLLTINPNARHDWEKLVLRNPLSGERPELSTMVAQVLENEPGSYLVAVDINIQILEEGPIQDMKGVELPKIASNNTTGYLPATKLA